MTNKKEHILNMLNQIMFKTILVFIMRVAVSVLKDHNLLRPTILSGIAYSSVTTMPSPWCELGLGTDGGGADDGGPTPNC